MALMFLSKDKLGSHGRGSQPSWKDIGNLMFCSPTGTMSRHQDLWVQGLEILHRFLDICFIRTHQVVASDNGIQWCRFPREAQSMLDHIDYPGVAAPGEDDNPFI